MPKTQTYEAAKKNAPTPLMAMKNALDQNSDRPGASLPDSNNVPSTARPNPTGAATAKTRFALPIQAAGFFSNFARPATSPAIMAARATPHWVMTSSRSTHG